MQPYLHQEISSRHLQKNEWTGEGRGGAKEWLQNQHCGTNHLSVGLSGVLGGGPKDEPKDTGAQVRHVQCGTRQDKQSLGN